MSPSGTATFFPEIFPDLAVTLIPDSLGKVVFSECAKVPIISPLANLGKNSFLISSFEELSIAVVAR